MEHIKMLGILVICICLLSACNNSSDIVSVSKRVIDNDSSIDCNIGKCYYNEEINVAYVKFFSMDNGEDDAVIMLDDNTIYYGGVYSQIAEDDYGKIIEYGDYALYVEQISSGDEDWAEVEVK